MNTFSDIEDFAELQRDWFTKWLKLPNGIPRSQTFKNIFALIDPNQLALCLANHLQDLSPKLASQVIAVDGKTLRGSSTLNEDAAHVVSAGLPKKGSLLPVNLYLINLTKLPPSPNCLSKWTSRAIP